MPGIHPSLFYSSFPCFSPHNVFMLCALHFLCGSPIQTRGPGGAGLLPAPLAMWNSPLAVNAQKSSTGPGGQVQVSMFPFSPLLFHRSRNSTQPPMRWLLITGSQLLWLYIVQCSLNCFVKVLKVLLTKNMGEWKVCFSDLIENYF